MDLPLKSVIKELIDSDTGSCMDECILDRLVDRIIEAIEYTK